MELIRRVTSFLRATAERELAERPEALNCGLLVHDYLQLGGRAEPARVTVAAHASRANRWPQAEVARVLPGQGRTLPQHCVAEVAHNSIPETVAQSVSRP